MLLFCAEISWKLSEEGQTQNTQHQIVQPQQLLVEVYTVMHLKVPKTSWELYLVRTGRSIPQRIHPLNAGGGG